MVTSDGRMKQVVDEAFAAIAGIPSEHDSELRRIAFERVLDALLGDAAPNGVNGEAPTARATALNAPETSSEVLDDSYATEEQRAWAVAQSLQIEIDEARDLFDVGAAEPVLQMGSKRLSAQKSAATREIALLICSARTALGLDTGTDHIREAADQHSRLDPPNFMKTLTAMEQIVLRGSPKSHNRLVRLRVIGVEEARQLAAKLTA